MTSKLLTVNHRRTTNSRPVDSLSFLSSRSESSQKISKTFRSGRQVRRIRYYRMLFVLFFFFGTPIDRNGFTETRVRPEISILDTMRRRRPAERSSSIRDFSDTSINHVGHKKNRVHSMHLYMYFLNCFFAASHRFTLRTGLSSPHAIVRPEDFPSFGQVPRETFGRIAY